MASATARAAAAEVAAARAATAMSAARVTAARSPPLMPAKAPALKGREDSKRDAGAPRRDGRSDSRRDGGRPDSRRPSETTDEFESTQPLSLERPEGSGSRRGRAPEASPAAGETAKPVALAEGLAPTDAAAADAGTGEQDGRRRRRRRGGRGRDEAGTDGSTTADQAAADGDTDAAAGADEAPASEATPANEDGSRRGRGRDRQRREPREPREPREADSAPVAEAGAAALATGRPWWEASGDDAAAASPAPTVSETPAVAPAAPEPTVASAPAVVSAAEPVAPAAAVAEAPAAPAMAPAAPVAAASAPVASPVAAPAAAPVAPFVLALDDLQRIAEGAGLVWVNSDSDKVRQVQAAIAAEPQPVHVPRERPPLVIVDEGPLVLVETRKDLSQITLPFDRSEADGQSA